MPNPYWRVNSYGYPNPFGDDRARQAWLTLQSFFTHDSYSALKDYWDSGKAPRVLSSHTVESWKATFEEFGLLYVLSGSDHVRITPAGEQFFSAATAGNEVELAWIGLNLLLRYPLKGPRRSRGPEFQDSDLLIYWFIYSAMRELGNYFWWSELQHVLCTVFQRDKAAHAIETIRHLRGQEVTLDEVTSPDVALNTTFYNSLNQVVNHAGMNYLILATANNDSIYDATRTERRHWIKPEWLPTVDLALGRMSGSIDCDDASSFIARMPVAPDLAGDELAYFDYVGAPISPMTETIEISEMPFGPGTVAVLRENLHYQVHDTESVVGPITALCKLAQGQRIILEHDLLRTYIVLAKQRTGSQDVMVTVRPARPITDVTAVLNYLQDSYA